MSERAVGFASGVIFVDLEVWNGDKRGDHAGAIPVYLLRSEQAQLASETAQAERHLEAAETSFGDIADTLAKALDLLADCQVIRDPSRPRASEAAGW